MYNGLSHNVRGVISSVPNSVKKMNIHSAMRDSIITTEEGKAEQAQLLATEIFPSAPSTVIAMIMSYAV
jgi:hypothetical protein